jgi:cell division protein FtsB
MKNLTHRLSDDYLDIDLLDERAREVLGLMRPDEVIIR